MNKILGVGLSCVSLLAFASCDDDDTTGGSNTNQTYTLTCKEKAVEEADELVYTFETFFGDMSITSIENLTTGEVKVDTLGENMGIQTIWSFTTYENIYEMMKDFDGEDTELSLADGVTMESNVTLACW